ncbi:quinolinate synthase NadA [Megamonas funiformis]|uniref:quinolinate synthase NadA n=1 Tax=Megamonas funiformis TaxID=437897 RepID=UPI003999A716
MLSLKEEVEQLKKEKNAVILAHYYVPDDVQEVADYIGDSFYLSKIAKNIGADLIVFAGVSFMGESAKILNPKKKVLLPDRYADCAMAHMASVDKVKKMREQVEDLAVVCYINSTAELKAVSDVCVTSSNAVEIVKKLSNKNIFFIPDGNLGAYVASKVPEKNIICNDGYCPIHRKISVNLVIETKRAHPNALFLVHPECSEEVTNLADFVGSTSEIIKFATNSEAKEFIIGTENGVMYELKQKKSR